MGLLVAAVATYLVGTFLLSAGIIRLAPQSVASRRIRARFKLFLFLPVLLLFDCVHMLDWCGRKCTLALRKSFEALSGRKLLDGEGNAYSYFGQQAPRNKTRKYHGRPQSIPATIDAVPAKPWAPLITQDTDH